MSGVGTLMLRKAGLLGAAAVAGITVWILVLEVFRISPYIGRRPWQVWAYLVDDPEATAHRTAIGSHLLRTLGDFAVGYVAGLGLGFVLAVVFSLSAMTERIVTPTAMVLRSIPVIVITPLITLLLGSGTEAVTAIVALVVFLPTLANVLHGIRQAQERHAGLFAAYGASGRQLLTKVGVPGALPAILASARIAVPMAFTGAMIGEWLATGDGLGGFIASSSSSFDYDAMFASAVAVTASAMIAYTLVNLLDTLVEQRFTTHD